MILIRSDTFDMVYMPNYRRSPIQLKVKAGTTVGYTLGEVPYN